MTAQQKNVATTHPGISKGGGRATGEEAKNRRATLARMSDYLHPYRSQLISVTILVIIGTLFGLAGPILLGRAIDNYVITADIDGLMRFAILMGLVYLGAGITNLVQGLLMVGIAQHFVADIRSQLFAHIQTLSMDYHDRHRVGDLMSRVSNDTEAINRTLTNGLIDFTTNVLLFGGILVAMVVLNWQLALILLVVIPVLLYITSKITSYSRKVFRRVQHHSGDLNAVMEENISGIRVVKAFAREADTIQEFQAVNTKSRQVGIQADIISAALGPLFSTMSIVTITVALGFGGWLALRGMLEVGILTTFVIYIMNFFRPMRTMAMLYNQLQAALAGAERIFTVLDVAPTVADKPNAQPLPAIQGEVTFDHVSFEYEAGKPILTDVTLTAKAGATIALVGPTGAGKTTIISLLSRFYDVSEGAIYIDGHDIREIQQASLREQLGIVLQDTFLFSNTVMENIRYGRLDASDEEVYHAAKLANADRFIRLLPNGYQTNVSEQGHNFSEGQRQLLAIARAILADPRILILDEATSSVDTRTEVQIQEAFLRLLEGRTAFVIAHRLSTIRNADQVLVVNDHRIVERGTHEELLAMGGFYYGLYMSQYRRAD